MVMEKNQFANKVSMLRKQKGLTQTEVAKRLHISNKTVSRWETGDGYPETSLLIPLAELLEVSVDYLLKEDTATGCQETQGTANSETDSASRKSKWSQLTIFNKISSICLGILLLYIVIWIIMMLLAGDSEFYMSILSFITLIGAIIFQTTPWVGSISAGVGLVLGVMGKYNNQMKTSIILIVFNIALPLTGFVLLWFVA